MDSHVHVSLIPGFGFASTDRAKGHPYLVDAYFDQQPRSHLYCGVTQVLDPNPGISWQRFESAPQHPDYFRCEVITAPGTYPMVEYPEDDAERTFPAVRALSTNQG